MQAFLHIFGDKHGFCFGGAIHESSIIQPVYFSGEINHDVFPGFHFFGAPVHGLQCIQRQGASGFHWPGGA
jgi:hypothetical protein